jgi:hypothetical protein
MLMNDIKNVLYIGINLDNSKSGFMVIPKTRRTNYIIFLRFYYYRRVVTSAGGLFVSADIIRPIICVFTLTWFIRYIYY